MSARGDLIAVGGNNAALCLFSVSQQRPVRVLAGNLEDVFATVFHPNGRYVFSGAGEGMTRMWDIAAAKCVRAYQTDASVSTLAVDDTGKYLAVGSIIT